MKLLTRLFFAAHVLGITCASAAPFLLQRPVNPPDRGDIAFPSNWSDPGGGPTQANRVEASYEFTVPRDGWYVLSLQHLPSLAREVFVDGRRVSLFFGGSIKSVAEWADASQQRGQPDPEWTKIANLRLGAGRHTVSFKRVGRMAFPAGFARTWRVEEAGAAAQDRVDARIMSRRELRKGESLWLRVTGGGDNVAASYDIYRVNELTRAETKITTLEFPATEDYSVRDIEIPCDEEGVFCLVAKAGGRVLSQQEFVESAYFVIDTEPVTAPASDVIAEAARTLVYDIDCVANTINGAPVQTGENYWEANGETRVVTIPAGRYRESSNGLGPAVAAHPVALAENFSGFSYLLENVEPGKPCVIEIDHPDDDWRSVCVSIVDIYEKGGAGKKMRGYLPPTFGYETGGYLPLSNKMLTEKVMFWPNGGDVNLGIVSSRIGKRAAAARIRVYRVDGDLPALGINGHGRFIGMWMEEHERWHTHFNTPPNLPAHVRDFIGLKRTMQWLAHTGTNAFWPTVVAYQQATYDSPVLDGYLLKHYNLPRISALLCEKYGLSYVAEIFLARLRHFNETVMRAGVENPDDLYTRTWWGFSTSTAATSGGASEGTWPNWNILHPHVQDMMISIYGELADALADTRSFAGMSGRLDPWQWDGLYAISSLNWGYEDWTVREFEKDTGIKVPEGDDPEKRFESRYRFLTNPENKAGWIAWRSARLTDYLQRLVARIRARNPELTLFLCGDGRQDENHAPSIPADVRERFSEMGFDLEMLARMPGIAIVPATSYGRGKTFTYLADQKAYDRFQTPENLKIGYNMTRAAAMGGAYQEWGPQFPLAKLGAPLPRWHYCSSSASAGINALEPLAVILAEQDTMMMRDGGYPLLFGQRDFYINWMRAFASLPRKPFEPLPFARDPVAAWQRVEPDKTLFYVVNRERYAVEMVLDISGAREVLGLGRDETITIDNGRLPLVLAPFELRAFEAPVGASVTGATTSVPHGEIDFVKRRLTFAKKLLAEIEKGVFAGSFSGDEKEQFRLGVDAAVAALEAKSYWRVRTLLSSARMMSVYEKTGRYPERQVETRFPDLLENLRAERFDPDDPFLDAQALFRLRATPADSDAQFADTETFNPEWRFGKVVRAGDAGVIEFDLEPPAASYYQLSLGHVSMVPGELVVSLGGMRLSVCAKTNVAGNPEKTIFPAVLLPAGKTRLRIERASNSSETKSAFGIYATKLVPRLRPLNTTCWTVAAPFDGFWKNNVMTDANVKRGMETDYGPEAENAGGERIIFRNEKNQEIRWRSTTETVGTHEDAGVNFATRAGLTGFGIGYAQTFIESIEERDILIYIGSDWWANAWLNGELLKPAGNLKMQQNTGAYFNAWKPRPVSAKLKKGVNRLVVKNQGGSMYSWFTCYITDAGELNIFPAAR